MVSSRVVDSVDDVRVATTILITLAFGFAGCFGGQAPLDERYGDAHARFHNASPDAMQTQHEFEVPPGVPLVTIKASVTSDDGFEFVLRDSAGDRVGSYCCLDGNISWDRLEFLAADNEEGTWRLGIECPAACEYVVAIYLGEDVGEAASGFQSKYDDATFRIANAPTGTHDFSQTITVPPEAKSLEVRYSQQSIAEMDFDITTPGGDYFFGVHLPYKGLVEDGARKVLDPEPGPYTVDMECKTDCDYAIGFYVG